MNPQRFLRVAIGDETFDLALALDPPVLRAGAREVKGRSNEAWGYRGDELTVLGTTVDFAIGPLGRATDVALSKIPESGGAEAWHLDARLDGVGLASADENGTPLLEPAAVASEAPLVRLEGPLTATLSWILPADEGPGLEVCALLGRRGERAFMACDFEVLPPDVHPLARVKVREQLLEVVLDHRC